MKKGTGILVSTGNGNKVLSSQVIYFVEVLDHDLIYHTEQGDYTVREKLGNVEKQLANDSFFRCSDAKSEIFTVVVLIPIPAQ